MKGLKYVLRLLGGESPESIIKSMPPDDLDVIKGFARDIEREDARLKNDWRD